MAPTDGGDSARLPELGAEAAGWGIVAALEPLPPGGRRGVRRLVFEAPGLPQGFALESRLQRKSSPRARGGDPGGDEAVRTGDVEFDESVVVSGNATVARALLTASTRQQWRRLARYEAQLVDRRLFLPWPVSNELDEARAEARVQWCVECLVAMSKDTKSVPESLARTVSSDSDPNVRLLALEALVGDFRLSPQTEVAASAAMASGHLPLQVLAAKVYASEAGLQVLSGIVVDEGAGLDERVDALRCLFRTHAAHDLAAVVDASLAPGRPTELQLVAAGMVRVLKDARHLPRMVALLDARDAAVQVAAVEALEVVGDVRLERRLLALLDTSWLGEDVQRATIRALATLGTLEAVMPLQAVMTKGPFVPRRIREEAKDAIERIRARHPHAAPGMVSLGADSVSEGALSLPRSEEGSVSLPNGGVEPPPLAAQAAEGPSSGAASDAPDDETEKS